MSRVKGFVVTLEGDASEEYAEEICRALKLLRGVISVVPSVASIDDHINREQVRWELRGKLFEVLK